QIACEKKAYREALELVERSLMRNTRNYKARDLKAALLRKLGDLEEAEHVALETIRLDSADFGAYNERYLIHLARGEQIQAGALRNELTRLMRDDVHNSIALSVDYLHCGLHEERTDVMHCLGNLLYDKKRYAGAIQHWEASREADSSFATVHRNLALAYYNISGKADQALSSLEKALACNPVDARVFYELDQLYKKLGYAPE